MSTPSLLHEPYALAHAAARVRAPQAAGHRHAHPPDPPPGRARTSLAHVLAALAGRVDREAAWRALA